MSFTAEEKTILKMYISQGSDRDETINAMRENLPYVMEQSIADDMNSVIRKINAISNEDFKNIDFSDVLEVEPL